MKFRMGDELVCTNDSGWHYLVDFLFFWKRKKSSNGPKNGDVVIVAGYRDNKHMFLEEWGRYDAYDEDGFEKIMSDKELEENLEEVEFML